MIDVPDRTGTILTRQRVLVLVTLLALLVDLNSLPGTFIADDIAVVVKNPIVAGLEFGRIFSTDYWGKTGGDRLYRPLTIFSFALNRLAFGPDPFSFHMVNVLLHTGVTLCFALTLPALGFGPGLVVTAASLFAVHPIHADVVNVVVGRAELLVALFLFAGLWLALTKGRRAWPLVLGCYLAALLSKEHAVVFIPLLALADAFVRGRGSEGAATLRKRGPLYALLLAITVCWLLLRQWVFHAADAPALLIYPADNPLVGAGLLVRILTAAKVNLLYLANLLLPLRLQSIYSGQSLQVVAKPLSAWGLAALAYVALCGAAAVHGWRRRSGHGFGIPLFFIGFAVTANIIFVIAVLMADRFAYLPSAGYCLAAAGVLLLPARRATNVRLARTLLLLPLCSVLFLAALTLGRNAAFQDPEAFWRSVIKTDPGNVRAWFFLSQATQDANRPRDTERALQGAIAADPSFPDAHIAYSLLLLDQGRPAEAAAAARKGLDAAPGGVGLAQFALARAELQLERPTEALALLDTVASMYADAADYWSARGKALEALGRNPEALAAYQAALRIADDAEARWRLARLLLQAARYRESEETLRALLARNKTAGGYNLLGVVLALQNRSDDAATAFRTAIELDPAAGQYRANLERLSLRSLHRRP